MKKIDFKRIKSVFSSPKEKLKKINEKEAEEYQPPIEFIYGKLFCDFTNLDNKKIFYLCIYQIYIEDCSKYNYLLSNNKNIKIKDKFLNLIKKIESYSHIKYLDKLGLKPIQRFDKDPIPNEVLKIISLYNGSFIRKQDMNRLKIRYEEYLKENLGCKLCKKDNICYYCKLAVMV